MYSDIAPFYDRLYARFKNYGAEAKRIGEILSDRDPNAATLLDVG